MYILYIYIHMYAFLYFITFLELYRLLTRTLSIATSAGAGRALGHAPPFPAECRAKAPGFGYCGLGLGHPPRAGSGPDAAEPWSETRLYDYYEIH